MKDVDLPPDEATRDVDGRPVGARSLRAARPTMATPTAAARNETRVA
jgi:hypothetical protein